MARRAPTPVHIPGQGAVLQPSDWDWTPWQSPAWYSAERQRTRKPPLQGSRQGLQGPQLLQTQKSVKRETRGEGCSQKPDPSHWECPLPSVRICPKAGPPSHLHRHEGPDRVVPAPVPSSTGLPVLPMARPSVDPGTAGTDAAQRPGPGGRGPPDASPHAGPRARWPSWG